jgi:hypothetical protein
MEEIDVCFRTSLVSSINAIVSVAKAREIYPKSNE